MNPDSKPQTDTSLRFAMILLIDNYDSFVYNLARYLRELGCETAVARNDAISLAAIKQMRPAAIVISPGPCTPSEAGVSVEVIRAFYQTVPILGVCLGHQAIGQAFGGKVVRSPRPIHGARWPIEHDGSRLFTGLPNPLLAGRYHSLCLDEKRLPPGLHVTARTSDGVIMAIGHADFPLFGVQFHPESVLTEKGHQLLANFASIAGIPVGECPPGDYLAANNAEPALSLEREGRPLHW